MSFHDPRFLRLETKAEGDEAPDVEKAIADLTGAFETKMAGLQTEVKAANDAAKAAKDRADALEVRLNRPGQANPVAGPTLEQKAFEGFIRRGKESLGPDEVKTLRVADDTAGGFLAPPQLATEVLRALVQFSPVRAVARVGAMSAGEIKFPRLTKAIAASWVSEIQLRPQDEPRFGQTSIKANEMAVRVPISNQLLEDSAIDLEAEIRFEFGQAFGLLEGQAFVTGDGVEKPLGLLVDPAIQTVPSGHASQVTPEGLIAIMYALPAFYRNRGAWLLNGPTVGKIRGMRDTTGRFMWADALTEGQPPTLLGRPVIEAIDMPDVAANSTPVMFGDFASAFRIMDRVGLSVLRDPYTLASYGQTTFHARRRVGAAVVQPEAIRRLVIAAS